jgi:hypothetical protein
MQTEDNGALAPLVTPLSTVPIVSPIQASPPCPTTNSEGQNKSLGTGQQSESSTVNGAADKVTPPSQPSGKGGKDKSKPKGRPRKRKRKVRFSDTESDSPAESEETEVTGSSDNTANFLRAPLPLAALRSEETFRQLFDKKVWQGYEYKLPDPRAYAHDQLTFHSVSHF